VDLAASAKLGLGPSWPRDVIAAIGNYDEIYRRNLGPGGANVTMDRGLNRLWTSGGLLYSPPLR
jgi:general L-amino acid transport system substrate-binding protein